MPQMAPMNWMILYILFTMMFILLNLMNYYLSINKNMKTVSIKFTLKKLIWKW